MKLGLSIRDMYELGADFVDLEMVKVLSMEFDWKRRPTNPVIAVGDATAIYNFRLSLGRPLSSFKRPGSFGSNTTCLSDIASRQLKTSKPSPAFTKAA